MQESRYLTSPARLKRESLPLNSRTRADRGVPILVSLLMCRIFFLSSLWTRLQAATPHHWIEFKNGKLLYDSDKNGNRIPDFSTAGYGGGGPAIHPVCVR